jgi:hypothetical protein
MVWRFGGGQRDVDNEQTWESDTFERIWGGCPGGYPTSQKSPADYLDAIRFLVFNRLFSE